MTHSDNRVGEKVHAPSWDGLTPPYATVVADPPWPMPDSGRTTRGETDEKGTYTAKSGRVVDGTWWGRHRGGSVTIPYSTMTVEEIEALPVADIAARDAHLYLWTTNRHLEDAYRIARFGSQDGAS